MSSKKRELSEFLCREMLFDFITNHLSETDKEAVERGLKQFPALQDELGYLKNGVQYTQILAKIQTSRPLLDRIESHETPLQNFKGRWTRLPRYSQSAIKVLSLAIVVGVLVTVLPMKWSSRDNSKSFVLAEIEKQEPAPLNSDLPSVPVTTTSLVSENMVSPVTSTTMTVAVTPPPTTPAATVAVVTTTLLAPKVVKPPPTTLITSVASAGDGAVYRAFMFSPKIDELTPVISDKIRALGGEKAGEVDLGWRRKNGSYFHFVFPEDQLGTLETFLRAYSPVRIHKDPHRRVMPRGQIRIILWLEDQDGSTPPNEKASGKTSEEHQDDHPTGRPAGQPTKPPVGQPGAQPDKSGDQDEQQEDTGDISVQ